MINKLKRIRRKYLFLSAFFLSIFLITSLGLLGLIYLQTNPSQDLDVPVYTMHYVSQFDGTDANKPIYLVYQGFVYDVTEGREYYEEGGTYHSLAGKDSTLELDMFGGEIIKRKYTIVGKISN